MAKKLTIKQIEKHIDETFLYGQYEALYQQIKASEFLAEWLSGDDAKTAYGSDVAAEREKHLRADIDLKQKQLVFIKSLMQ